MGVRILFTKNNMIGSKLIQWGTEGDCSHFSVEFDDCVVLQSTMTNGVNVMSSNEFFEHNIVVHELNFNLSLEAEDAVWQPLVKGLAGKTEYDFKSFFYWSLMVIKHRIFGSSFPKTNKWDDAKKYMCVELALTLPDFLFNNEKPERLDFMSPQTLFHLIDAKTANSLFRVKGEK